MTNYPNSYDNNNSLPPVTPDPDGINNVIQAVIAIEKTLGILPDGVYASVRTRLDILEARINNPLSPAPNVSNPFLIGNTGVTISTGFNAPTENRLPGSLYLREDGYQGSGLYIVGFDGYWYQISNTGGGGSNVNFGGDLFGNDIIQNVIGLQGRPLSNAVPSIGNVITYNGTSWAPAAIPSIPNATSSVFGTIKINGDISGTASSIIVSKIQGRALSNTAPTDGYVLTWSNTNQDWEPKPPSGGGGGLDTVYTAVNSNIVISTINSGAYAGLSGLTADRSVFLPFPPPSGQRIVIKDEDGSLSSHNIIINGNGANIDGSSTFTLSSIQGPRASLTVMGNGTNWSII